MKGMKIFVVAGAIAITQAFALAQNGGDSAQKRVLTLAGARAIASAAQNEARRLNTTGARARVPQAGRRQLGAACREVG